MSRGVTRDKIEFGMLMFMSILSAGAAAGIVYVKATTDEDGNPHPTISLHDPIGTSRERTRRKYNYSPPESSERSGGNAN